MGRKRGVFRSINRHSSPGTGNTRALLLLIAMAIGCGAVFLFGRGPVARADSGPQFADSDMTLVLQRAGELKFITIEMLMADDGTPDFAQRVAAGKADILSRFPGAVEVNDAQVSAAYALKGFSWASHSATWAYNATGRPTGLTGDTDAIAAAAASWATVGANFHFTSLGTTTATPGECENAEDGQNTVGWHAQPDNVLALTCASYNPLTGAASEFDMEIDPDFPWTTSLTQISVDLQSVTAHEFGHALGLAHTSDKTAMMYATYIQGSNKRQQQSDDIAGITAIYGASAATPTVTPVPVVRPATMPFRIAAAAIGRD